MAQGIPFMMASDQWTAAKWAQLGIGSHSLFGLRVADFEVVRPLDPTLGDGRDGRIKLTFDCKRNGDLPARALGAC